MASVLTPTGSPLFSIFGLLGAGAATGTMLGNGFGVAAGTDMSAFALTLGGAATTDAGLSTGANALLKTAAAAAKKAADEKTDAATDLGSPDLLMSDLMAVNLQAIQPGDTVQLPNGWSLSADQDGLLTLQNEAAGIAFPPFTKDQLQQALNMFAPALPQVANDDGSELH